MGGEELAQGDEIESIEEEHDGADLDATQVLDDRPCLSDDIEELSSDTQLLVSQQQRQDRAPAAEKADSDATTVDDGAGEDATGAVVEDTASSGQLQESQDDPAEIRPTLILEELPATPTLPVDTQILSNQVNTQIIDQVDEGKGFLLENAQEEISREEVLHHPVKVRSLASVRTKSLRASALVAYEKLVARLKDKPHEAGCLEDSARFVLDWGTRQKNVSSPPMIPARSVVEESIPSCSTVTPNRTQPSTLNVPAMWSNNKKPTGETYEQIDAASPVKVDNTTLDRVRKSLFLKDDLLEEPRRQEIVVATAETTLTGQKGKELSYLNSQEPGEESQNKALQAIERLPWLNSGEFSQDAQLNEYEVEPRKLPNLNLLSTLAQVQNQEPAKVFDFVTSQEDPLMGSQGRKDDEQAVTPDGARKSNKREGGEKQATTKNSGQIAEANGECDAGKAAKNADPHEKIQAKKQQTPSRKKKIYSTPKVPRTAKKRHTSPKETTGRAASASPVTPVDAPAPPSARSQSATRKRKGLNEQLILSEDTPRRCRRRPVKVLFSHSLDKETMEEQKKILRKLSFDSVTKASDCTHFVTDRFSRTANMLQVLAAGKPVVSLGWLESCSVAGCAVDERNFILEDSKKEKELGFSMQTTFTSAQQKPLLKGMKVYVTPNTMQEPVTSVVKAAGGRLVKKCDPSDEDCIVVSCEEDEEFCAELRNKGVRIYSTEFIFSGIVSYHLDFSRNLLFETKA